METVYAVVLMNGYWAVSVLQVNELVNRVSLGSCAVYDSKGRDLLECIAKFQNTADGFRK
jgi:hypothetical protein